MTTSTLNQVRPHIRWMIRRDLPEVLQIEQDSFDCAWTEEDFLRCLRQRNAIGMVVEDATPGRDSPVMGYMIYELGPARLTILNLAVGPRYRRCGVGRAMILKLASKLSAHRRNRLRLAVRETNLAAQLFFRATGFRAVRVLRNYCEDSGEDAYLMRYGLAKA